MEGRGSDAVVEKGFSNMTAASLIPLHLCSVESVITCPLGSASVQCWRLLVKRRKNGEWCHHVAFTHFSLSGSVGPLNFLLSIFCVCLSLSFSCDFTVRHSVSSDHQWDSQVQMLVHFQRYQCIEFVRPFPNLIESLDRSATQTAKQMDVAVGEKNTAGFGLGSYGNSQKIAEVCYVKSLLGVYCQPQVQRRFTYSHQAGK